MAATETLARPVDTFLRQIYATVANFFDGGRSCQSRHYEGHDDNV